jgi:hypothetical protein
MARMATEDIRDRRRMFELFTELKVTTLLIPVDEQA